MITHTHANLEVSSPAYAEIHAKLRKAGYDHAFGDDGTIDMHGIALVPTNHPQAEVKPRHPSIEAVLQFFACSHLPAHLQFVAQPFAELAQQVASGPQNAETTMALRKLLEAKDCAVRAVLAK